MTTLTTRAGLALLLALTPVARLTAQHAPASFARVDSALLDELRRMNTPGAAIAIVSGDSVVYARGFGRTSADGQTPVTPGTEFRIASVTKVFTAAMLVALAESGRLDLDAPLGDRLGALPDSLRAITPHQLLSHTAGLIMAPVAAAPADSDVDLAAAMPRVMPRAAFAQRGEIFSYSNLGYQLAGRMIEVAGGQPYADQVRSTILAPLGMEGTTFDSATAARIGLASGTAGPPTPATVGWGPTTWPFAGLYSNVLDLSRFAIAFMNGGKYKGKQVLSPSAIARISRPVAPFSSGEGDYGYGVRVYRHRGVDVVEHGGFGQNGYRSLLYMVPSRRVAVIVLANRAGRRPYAVADAALEAVLPNALEPVAASPAEVAMDSSEMARYVGRYAAGMVVEVSVDGGVLTLHQGMVAMPIRKMADGRFVAQTEEGGAWVAFVAAGDGRVKYLHTNMRAFRRL
ncbi:MAG TPA: serine hydrolase [Gemmatimonadaceae bacterium]